MDLAQQLRNAVKASGIKQADLAEQAKVSQSVISGFLAGADVRVATAERIAKVVGRMAVLKVVR